MRLLVDGRCWRRRFVTLSILQQVCGMLRAVHWRCCSKQPLHHLNRYCHIWTRWWICSAAEDDTQLHHMSLYNIVKD